MKIDRRSGRRPGSLQLSLSLLLLLLLLSLLLPSGAAPQDGPALVRFAGSVDTLYQRSVDSDLAAGATTLADLIPSGKAGLVVTRSSGVPGDAAELSVRESRWSGAGVVVVVDGVRLDTNVEGFGRGADPLLWLDPGLVERVELVRGPVAAARWGPDAAAGLLLVTTRRDDPPDRWRMDAAATLGFTAPGPGHEPYWLTCDSAEEVAPSCEGRPLGSVVAVEAVVSPPVRDTRPLESLRWSGSYRAGPVAVQGAAHGERRPGAATPDGFGRRGGRLGVVVAPHRTIEISAAAAGGVVDVGFQRLLGDESCVAAGGQDAAGLQRELCRGYLAHTPPTGEGIARTDDRTHTQTSFRLDHRPFTWLRHTLTFAGYHDEEIATHSGAHGIDAFRPDVSLWGLTDRSGRTWDYSLSAAYRGTALRGIGFSLEAGARGEKSDRLFQYVSSAFGVEEEGVSGILRERGWLRLGGEISWQQRAFLRGGVARARPMDETNRDSVELPTWPSIESEVRWEGGRVYAGWGRVDGDPASADQASGMFGQASMEREMIQAGGTISLWENRIDGSLVASRTSTGFRTARRLDTMGYTTDALELSVDLQAVRRPRLGWEIGASVLAQRAVVSVDSPLWLDPWGLDGPLIVVLDKEAPGSFWAREIIRLDTAANMAVVSDSGRVAGHLSPKIEASLRSQFRFGSIRVGAVVQLRHGATLFDRAARFRFVHGVSRGLHDPNMDEAQRLRAVGPWLTESGVGTIAWEPFLHDGSFVRLRTLAVTARLPSQVGAVALPEAELTVAGRDLFVLSPYHGPDPETNNLRPPHPRTVVSRLSVRF